MKIEIKKAPSHLLERKRLGCSKYPIGLMKVGEMIELPCTIPNRTKLILASNHFKKNNPHAMEWDFITRQTDYGTVALIRIK